MENIDLKKLKELLDKNYGEGNWRIRKVSRNKRSMNIPSLTITEDLERIGCKPNDLVIVAVQNNRIIIYRV